MVPPSHPILLPAPPRFRVRYLTAQTLPTRTMSVTAAPEQPAGWGRGRSSKREGWDGTGWASPSGGAGGERDVPPRAGGDATAPGGAGNPAARACPRLTAAGFPLCCKEVPHQTPILGDLRPNEVLQQVGRGVPLLASPLPGPLRQEGQ